MEQQQILEKIKNSLKRCSLNYKIEPSKVRIKLELSKNLIGSSLKITIMNGVNDIEEVSLKNILDLNAIESTIVSPILVKKISSKAEQLNVDKYSFNARIYTKDNDFNPSLYFFNGIKSLQEANIKEFL